jgi:hypothetical protein
LWLYAGCQRAPLASKIDFWRGLIRPDSNQTGNPNIQPFLAQATATQSCMHALLHANVRPLPTFILSSVLHPEGTASPVTFSRRTGQSFCRTGTADCYESKLAKSQFVRFCLLLLPCMVLVLVAEWHDATVWPFVTASVWLFLRVPRPLPSHRSSGQSLPHSRLA